MRTVGEFEAGHAPGARRVDPKELLADPVSAVWADDPLAEPDPHFVLMCDTGLRSGHLAHAVREQGFRVDFITGGLLAWREAGEILIPGPERRR